MTYQSCVVILAAGYGTRLLPFTEELPKPIIRVCGKTIITHQIEAFKAAGIQEKHIYIVIGHGAEKVKMSIGTAFPQINFLYNKDYKISNSMVSLYYALDAINPSYYKTFFITNGDNIYAPALIEKMIQAKSCAIAYKPALYNAESIKIQLDKEGIPRSLSKDISLGNSAGIANDCLKFNAFAFKKLKGHVERILFKEKKKNLFWMVSGITPLLKEVDFALINTENLKWIEIDDFDDLAVADRLFSHFSWAGKKHLLFQEALKIDLRKFPKYLNCRAYKTLPIHLLSEEGVVILSSDLKVDYVSAKASGCSYIFYFKNPSDRIALNQLALFPDLVIQNLQYLFEKDSYAFQ